MSNFYVLRNRETGSYRKADGSMTGDIGEAEQMNIHDAMQKEIEVFASGDKVTELYEVPLMHEAQYEDAMDLTDPAGDFFDNHGIDLVVEIGAGDETTWTLTSRTTGQSVRVTLEDCHSFEVNQHEGDE